MGVVGGGGVFLVGLDVAGAGEDVLGGAVGLLGVLRVTAHDGGDQVVHVTFGLGVFAVVAGFLQDGVGLGIQQVLVGFEAFLHVLEVPLVLVLLPVDPLFVHGTVLPQLSSATSSSGTLGLELGLGGLLLEETVEAVAVLELGGSGSLGLAEFSGVLHEVVVEGVAGLQDSRGHLVVEGETLPALGGRLSAVGRVAPGGHWGRVHLVLLAG